MSKSQNKHVTPHFITKTGTQVTNKHVTPNSWHKTQAQVISLPNVLFVLRLNFIFPTLESSRSDVVFLVLVHLASVLKSPKSGVLLCVGLRLVDHIRLPFRQSSQVFVFVACLRSIIWSEKN